MLGLNYKIYLYVWFYSVIVVIVACEYDESAVHDDIVCSYDIEQATFLVIPSVVYFISQTMLSDPQTLIV